MATLPGSRRAAGPAGGASLPRPKLDLVLRDLCPKRDSLGHASILGDEAEHQRGCRPTTLGLCLHWKASTSLT